MIRLRSIRMAAGCALILAGTLPALAADNEAPSKPLGFTASALSHTSIQLSWNKSTDNRRVKNYRLLRNGELVAKTSNLSYTDNGLQPSTSYAYDVMASDGFNISFVSSLSITTLDSGTEPPVIDESVPESTRGNGKGKNRKPLPEEPLPEEPPAENPPETGAPQGWNLVFYDDFAGSGDIDTTSDERNWRFETMDDGLHRAGNTGLDAQGNVVASWDSVRGKRWSGWYNKFNAVNAYRENGVLVMGGIDSGESDPTRPIAYVDNGIQTAYGSSKLYTAWLDTWSRKWIGPADEHVVDPASPGKSFKYGYFEAHVSFSEMKTPGFRLSMWLMPASTDATGQNLVVSNAYDGDGNNGVEIDLFEYEWIGSEKENLIQLAVHGGNAGGSATLFDTSTLGINLHDGYHTIGFLWQADKMVWSIDGHAVKQVSDAALIPDVYSFLIISREMNSGVKNPDIDSADATDMLEEWPYIPRDPGLYAKNIWEFRDQIATDRALLDYIRIWQP